MEMEERPGVWSHDSICLILPTKTLSSSISLGAFSTPTSPYRANGKFGKIKKLVKR
jgi:hypothetical protein